MPENAYILSGSIRIKTTFGYESYEEAIRDSSTMVETQRGPVLIRQLMPEDKVILRVEAGSMPGLIATHG